MPTRGSAGTSTSGETRRAGERIGALCGTSTGAPLWSGHGDHPWTGHPSGSARCRPGREVTLGGNQLTFRPVPQVIADLADAGFVGTQSGNGVDYPEGFSVWSMGSLMIEDIDQPGDADEDDEVVEGVSIAAAGYFEDM